MDHYNGKTLLHWRGHPTRGPHLLSSQLAAQTILPFPYLSLYFNTHALLSLIGWYQQVLFDKMIANMAHLSGCGYDYS